MLLRKKIRLYVAPLLFTSLIVLFVQCASFVRKTDQVVRLYDTIYTHERAEGVRLGVTFQKGSAYKFPLMAVWVTDTTGKYIQTLYVAESIAKGVFRHGDSSEGFWKPGPIRRPAALPYWSHSRAVKAEDGLLIPSEKMPMHDAFTGATPQSDFYLSTGLYSPLLGAYSGATVPYYYYDESIAEPLQDSLYYIYFEINQPFDWNDYWHNNKFPEDSEYLVSAQPAIVYRAKVNLSHTGQQNNMELIGHSHFAGKDGSLTKDISTLSSALRLVNQVIVSVQ